MIRAFLLGLWERLRWGDGFGRTWDDDQGKNEAYDHGANLADLLTGNR